MKIRLVQPSQLDANGSPIKYSKLLMPSLAMPTIAGMTPEDIDVRITTDCIEDIDFDEDVDLVGLTALTCQAPRAYQIAAEFRKRGTKTIMGGIHVSMLPEEALNHVDSVLIGEAENQWEHVLRDVEKKRLKTIYKSEKRPDMSNLVIPRFGLLKNKHYVNIPFSKKPFFYLPIQASRGCPVNCDFCSVVRYSGSRIRKKPVSHVIKEMDPDALYVYVFADDNIIADSQYSKELFTAMKPLNLRWYGQFSTIIVDRPDLIDLAAESGCVGALIGIESLNCKSLVSMNKKINNPSDYERLFKRLKEAGIYATASVIFGFDDDDYDALLRMIDRLLSMDVNLIFIFILTPFPKTKLHERMLDQGRILSSDWSLYDAMNTVIKFRHLSPENMIDAYWKSYEKFYSFSNILKQTWRFTRQNIRFFPRQNIFMEFHFKFSVRRIIHKKKHPFILGL